MWPLNIASRRNLAAGLVILALLQLRHAPKYASPHHLRLAGRLCASLDDMALRAAEPAQRLLADADLAGCSI
jgi:hypothetical protein